ncbi:MAG: serine hydrolase, partial [Gemmatimonadaceae bacterium]|nr:serine hydrolase [Gemmatimonadaceae bacterium]
HTVATAAAALAATTTPALRARANPGPAAASEVPAATPLIAALQARLQHQGVGLVAAVVDGDPVVFAAAGRRSLASEAAPDADTLFEIGSITKTFTTAILADMVKRGEVSLSDPVAKLLPPGTVVPSRDGREITLLDLATQSSGLPSLPTNFAPKDQANPWADYSPQQLYDYLKSYQLTRGIGEKYEYSNVGMGLLGFALAQRAGMTYEDLVAARVLKPLQMDDTRITLTAALLRRLAPGHRPDGSVVKNWDLTTLAGAGALRSTVNDMLTYIRANADSASNPLGATLAMTHGERHSAGSPAVTIGLGWHRLRTPAGNWIVWHNGGTGGYRSFTGYSEKTGEGIVVLANTANSVDEIGMHLLDPSFPLPSPPKTRVAVSLPEATLDRYVGTFELAPAFALVITREGAQLHLQATGQPRFSLFAEKEDEFFLKVVDAQVTFTKDGAGVVTGLVLHQNGAHLPAKKKP